MKVLKVKILNPDGLNQELNNIDRHKTLSSAPLQYISVTHSQQAGMVNKTNKEGWWFNRVY